MTEFVELVNILTMSIVKLKVALPLASDIIFPRSPTCLTGSVRSPWVIFVGLKWIPVESQPCDKSPNSLEQDNENMPTKGKSHALNMHSSRDISIQSCDCAHYGNIWIRGQLCKSDIATVRGIGTVGPENWKSLVQHIKLGNKAVKEE